jgi:hypothetical protein
MAWTERYVDAAAAGGGDGTTAATSGGSGAWTIAEAVAIAHAAGIRVNVKAGTYTMTTTDLTIVANSATGAAAVWWRGYNTAIGDIDSDNTLAKPLIVFTTGYFLVSADFNWLSNLRFEGANTTLNEGVFRVNAPDCKIWRCRFTGTAADVDCIAFDTSASCDRTVVHSCYMTANAAAPCARAQDDASFVGCVFDGGLTGLVVTTGGPCLVANSLFKDHASYGVHEQTATSSTIVINCTFFTCGVDSIRTNSAAGSLTICNNVFDTAGGYHINCSAGAFAGAQIFNNSYRASTSGDLGNIYESHQVGNVTESVSPFTNAAGGDFTLLSTALSKAAGFPGALENSSLIGYLDLGALQRQEAGGGGGSTRVIGG